MTNQNSTIKSGSSFDYFTNFEPTAAFENDARRIVGEAKAGITSAFTVKSFDVQFFERISKYSPPVHFINLTATTRRDYPTLEAVQQEIDSYFTNYGRAIGGIKASLNPLYLIGGGLLAVLLLKKLLG